jgi:hypothetical protein
MIKEWNEKKKKEFRESVELDVTNHLPIVLRFVFFFVIRARGLGPRCTAACRLIVLPLYRASILDVATFRCQSVASSVLPERPLAAKGRTLWARINGR